MIKIQLLIKELRPVLQTVISVVEKKHNIPILSHVLIQLNNQKLTLITTDSEIQVQSEIAIKDKTQCRFTLYAKNLIDIIKNLDEDTMVFFEIDNNKIKININKNIFKLNGFNHSDFPVLISKTQDTYQTIQVNALDLKNLIDKTSFTIANQDIRVYLNGLYLESLNNELTMVSTDGYRLSIGSIKQLNTEIEKITAIIPKKTILEISKLLFNNTKNDLIDIKLSKNYLNIQSKNTQIISQLINSNYPNYQQVIPAQSKGFLAVNRQKFIELLRSISPLVNENNKSIKLQLNNNELVILTQSERGSAQANIAVTTTLKQVDVSFNINYLLTVLEKLEDDIIHIVLPKENESHLFINKNNSNYQYVIMPIKV